MYSCVSEINKKAKCLYILYLLHVIKYFKPLFYLNFHDCEIQSLILEYFEIESVVILTV